MFILAKATFENGKFKEWDTSTADFYFKGWTGDPQVPLWDLNQWFAYRFETYADVLPAIKALQELGYTVAMLGHEFIDEPDRARG